MKCTVCGAPLAAGAAFCPECGHVVPTSAETPAAPAFAAVGVTPAKQPCRPRPWVIIVGVLLIVTGYGAIFGIPLILVEWKLRAPDGCWRLRRWGLAGYILAAMALTGAMLEPQQSDEAYQKGVEAIAVGDYEEARSQLKQVTAGSHVADAKRKLAEVNRRLEEKRLREAKANESRQDAAPPAGAPASGASSADSQPGLGGEERYVVLDTVPLRNHEITVIGVDRDYRSDNVFVEPDPGRVFVVVRVRLRNTSDSDLPVNLFGFELEDDAGVMRTPELLTDVEDLLESATLRPGGVIEGNIAFQAKQGSKVLNLHYSGGIWNEETVIDLTHIRVRRR